MTRQIQSGSESVMSRYVGSGSGSENNRFGSATLPENKGFLVSDSFSINTTLKHWYRVPVLIKQQKLSLKVKMYFASVPVSKIDTPHLDPDPAQSSRSPRLCIRNSKVPVPYA